MVGVNVRVQGVLEVHAKLTDDAVVAFKLLTDRINENSLLGLQVPEEVGVGPGAVVEQLAEADRLGGCAHRSSLVQYSDLMEEKSCRTSWFATR